MKYRFKYKLIKNNISKYFNIRELNLNVANENTFVNIDIDENYKCQLSINQNEAPVVFEGDCYLVESLELLKQMFVIAKAVEYIPYGEDVVLTDGDICTYIKIVEGFGFPVILIGDADYIIGVPVTNEFDDSDVESLVASLKKCEEEHGFPYYQDLKIKVSDQVLSSLSIGLLETNLFEEL